MKFKVSYYDYDSDNTIEKYCFEFNCDTKENKFSFIPVDNPVKIYKSVIIDSPVTYIGYNNGKLKIVVEGYQMIKDSGYWKTETIITNIEED